MNPEDIKEIEAANEQLSAELAGRENGAKVVLLVSGNEYGEVIRKSEIAVTLAFYNRYSEMLTSELETRGFKPVVGYRVLKANGTVMYLVPVEGGTDLYTLGKYFPAVKAKK